jgi:hypothetical protein
MKAAERNKWLKHLYLVGSNKLAPHLLETKLFTKANFRNMIRKYRHVIVKPVKGSRGRDVVQVSVIGNKRYRVHLEGKSITIWGNKKVYRYLKRKVRSESYVIQRRVPRATVKGRPFDLRVIVQRKSNTHLWEVTAKVAKVAGKGYIVSNITRSKGTLLLVDKAIRKSSIKHFSTTTLNSRIDRLAILTAKRLDKFFKGHPIYGLDIGIDELGHVWLIEANLYPFMSHFQKLKDKTMYHRIMEYKKGFNLK